MSNPADHMTEAEQDALMGVRATDAWHVSEYTGSKPLFIPDENYVPKHPLHIQLLGLLVWLLPYILWFAIVAIAFALAWHVLTTPTADRSPLMNWWMS